MSLFCWQGNFFNPILNKTIYWTPGHWIFLGLFLQAENGCDSIHSFYVFLVLSSFPLCILHFFHHSTFFHKVVLRLYAFWNTYLYVFFRSFLSIVALIQSCFGVFSIFIIETLHCSILLHIFS